MHTGVFERFAVAVLIVSPQGIPLVRDPRKPPPRYWKLPGGRGQKPETPEHCAIREIRTEIGLALLTGELKEVFREDRDDHSYHFFYARVRDLASLRSAGEEGEIIRVFHAAEALEIEELFPRHRRLAGLILAELVRRS